MKKPPIEYVATALDIIELLDTIKINSTKLDPTSQAARENEVAIRSGIDPKGHYVSIPGVCHHLCMKLHAAREHLLGAIWLFRSNAERTLVNPIQSLTRSATEASATCLWLCSNKATWEERLRRLSQLHLRSAYTCLVDEGIDPNDRPVRSTMDQNAILTLDECDTVIREVRARGWTCAKGRNKGKEPTITTWVRELPTYSDLMKEASVIIPASTEVLKGIYSTSSRSVHTDPVTVASGSTEQDELNRLSNAASAITTAFGFYSIAWKLLASWCSAPYTEDAIGSRIDRLHQLAGDN